MVDEKLARGTLERIEYVIGVLIEDAHELAVAAAPKDWVEHAARHAMLRRVGSDVVTLVDACEVLVRRALAELSDA